MNKICSECGKYRRLNDMLHLHDNYICMDCKDIHLQRLREAADDAEAKSPKSVIFVNHELMAVELRKLVLDEAGIACYIRNYHDFTMGELHFPCLCLVNLDDYQKALALLSELEESLEKEEWTCDACGEINPGTFECCWQCADGDAGDNKQTDGALQGHSSILNVYTYVITLGIAAIGLAALIKKLMDNFT